MMLARLDWEAEAAPILEQMRLRGREAEGGERDVFAREPDTDEVLDEAMRAYHESSTCRAIGMAAGPIPQDAIDRWCDRHGLDEDNYRVYSDAIHYVDNIMMRRAANKRQAGGS